MRARGNLLDERLRRRLIPFKPTRVVEHQVYPGRPAISARADQRAIVSRRSKAYLKQRIRQMLLLVHRFIQHDKVVASLKRLHIRHRKLEFLMKVIDGAVESLIRSEEHTSELQSRGLISYAVFCLKKKK